MIYKDIAKSLRIQINSAGYQIGDPLPAEKSLAQQYNVSRMTIRKAVDLLVTAGLLKRKHGSGTYIKEKDVHHENASLKGFVELMANTGHNVRSEVIEFSVIPCPLSIASKLRINSNERIFYSRRIRYVDNKPLIVEDSYMPVKYFRNLTLTHLEGSKFDFIENICQIKIAGSYETFHPIIPDNNICQLLKIENNIPILRLSTLSYSTNGDYINYSIMYRNTQDYIVEYHLKREQ
ncbi:GntR family transcriptional regulator [Proteus penneri]|uniref:Putative HTH-type transcriptional regulator YidP n=1 Tax=Proteus penneri TaxID=102862 RepID=A0A0G4QD58_9GAMM|nr:GntR family transcriptional regulator [Proteus penneri]CRL63529.1 putative HTH-type transcriptional regulator YidP [Proteus penneri]